MSETSYFSTNEQVLDYLANFLRNNIADIDSSGLEVADYVAEGKDPEFNAKLKAMFEWIEQQQFQMGRLKQLLKDYGLSIFADDQSAREYLNELYLNVFGYIN